MTGVAPETAREVDALTGLLAGAIGGVGYRGPSTDPAVIARRLVESDRVRVDVPGRLTVEQVADLALRAGRAETTVRDLSVEVGRLGTLASTLEETLAVQAAEIGRLREALADESRSAALAWDLHRTLEHHARTVDAEAEAAARGQLAGAVAS